MAKPIDAKFLKGFFFRYTEDREETDPDSGQKTTVHVAMQRDLTPDDVLDWADKGDMVIICTADGKKYRVTKKGVPADA